MGRIVSPNPQALGMQPHVERGSFTRRLRLNEVLRREP